jgi:NAD(P)-dependent dehydrogenase (short-subunit alcohol dehydrogenase family)
MTRHNERRVALICRAGTYAGPALARRLAAAGHDLLLHGARPGQRDELARFGVEVEVIDENAAAALDASAEGWREITGRLQARFGRLDAAALFPPPPGGPGFARGPFLAASVEQLREQTGYLDTTLFALQAVIPLLRGGSGGQIVVFTSDAGARPEREWSLYGAARAGQNFLVRAVALEHAHEGICLNAIGSKNAVFEGFPGAPAGAVSDAKVVPGAWSAALEKETPLGRLGTMEELAAFAQVLLDGSNRFQTANCFSYSGGWQAL